MKVDDKSKEEPLLDQNLNKEFTILSEENNVFNNSIDSITKELNTKNVDDDTTISQLTNKLQNIKLHMERINSKILYLKNYLKDGNNENQKVILEKIKMVSENISKKYELVNQKFMEKISNAKSRIDLELSENENLNKNELVVGGGMVQVQTQNVNKQTSIKMDRLRERKEDLEKISKISQQLLELSRDMRRSAFNQGAMVLSIEDNLEVANIKVNEANEQLNQRRDSQSTNINLYFWICTLLFIVLAIAIFIIYWKYWRIPEVNSQSNNQNILLSI